MEYWTEEHPEIWSYQGVLGGGRSDDGGEICPHSLCAGGCLPSMSLIGGHCDKSSVIGMSSD